MDEKGDDMGQGWLAIILGAALIAGFIISAVRGEAKLKARIEESFGKRPEPEQEISQIAEYWEKRRNADASEHHIDAMTWDDLDMDKVFQTMDACQSGVGASQLYALLHEPCLEGDKLAQREKLMELLEADPAMRLQLQVYYAKMGRPPGNALASFCYGISEKRVKRPWIYLVMTALPVLCAGVIFVSVYVGVTLLVLSLVANGVAYYRTSKRIETELVGVKQFSALLWCAGKITETHALDGHPTGQAITQGHKLFKNLGGRLSGLTQQRVSDFDFLAEYFRIITLSNIRGYNRVIKALEENIEVFRNLYRSVGELDAMMAVLSYRKSLAYYCLPDFIADGRLEMTDVYHPLIKNPVINSLSLTRGCLISGSNASGKSTFIKAAAVNALLAQTVNTCLAGRFVMRHALVITSMAVRDNVTAGESYFVTEIKSLRRILDKDIFFICFIDEILKGTNTAERIAASAAVLKHFESLDGLCVAATHDIELTRMLSGSYDNYHFEEKVTDEGIVFDYKIKPGPTRTRNAIKLLEFMDFDTRITEDAYRLAQGYDASGQWPGSV